MGYTMLKSTYAKWQTKILKNCFYKDFNKESFRQALQHELSNNGKFAEFNGEFKSILNHHAPIKQSKLHGNSKPHIKGALSGPLKKMKNAFYFISKALFVLKIFRFLSWHFGHVARRLNQKDKVNFLNLWHHNLANKQSKYTYCPTWEIKAIRQLAIWSVNRK